MTCLRYGIDSSLDLEVAARSLVAWCDAPRGEPLGEVGVAIRQALAGPLDFPPLAQAVVPGDKVAIALDPAVPQSQELVSGAVSMLLSAGVLADDITLVVSPSNQSGEARDHLNLLAPEIRDSIATEVHDPKQRGSLSYLGATSDEKPIYINRVIYDADFVISIGLLRPDTALGYHGVNSTVFPAFADAAEIARHHNSQAEKARARNKLRKRADEVGWMLGARFTIQVVPGRSDHILHVLAGDSAAVYETGNRLYEDAWACHAQGRAELVVATIEGDKEQTWENVARALASAAVAMNDGSAVAICTDLDERLGPALERIVGCEDLDEALREIDHSLNSDWAAGVELVLALQRGKVYLVSRLDDELVEDLGISPLGPDQLSRLAARYDSCLVFENAHRAVAHVASAITGSETSGRRTRS
jgi:nickel-dependent lactate racemase